MLEDLPRLEARGQLTVGNYRFSRLALGCMRLLSGNANLDGRTVECFADPMDPEANAAVMRAAVSRCGIGYLDFARGYGARPGAGETWFRAWMEPYPKDLLWATKVGYQRDAQGGWILNLDPDFLRRELEWSLQLLGRPIPLMYLTVSSTSDVTIKNRPASLIDSLRPLVECLERGEVEHLGVANVTSSELSQILEMVPISAVQNKFTVASLSQANQRAVLNLCSKHRIPFVAWGIFQSDDESAWTPTADLVQASRELEMSPQEASIAILLQSCPNLVALTGASRLQSLASSVRAANRSVPDSILGRFNPVAGE